MPLLRPHKHLGTGSPALDLRRPALLAHHGHSERLGHGSGRGRGRVNEPLADGLRKGGDSRKTGPAEPSLDFCFKSLMHYRAPARPKASRLGFRHLSYLRVRELPETKIHAVRDEPITSFSSLP